MLLTRAMRLFLGGQLAPFKFERDRGFLPGLEVPNLGLYVHIPFCRDVCPFCPYYKVKLGQDGTGDYLAALLGEIRLVSGRLPPGGGRRKVSSLYFGGGSPAVMLDDLHKIRRELDKYFRIEGRSGIELHPRDVTADVPAKLRDAGFDMVSVGIQSFSKKLLRNLGRTDEDGVTPLEYLNKAGFKAIDVDLIFGIPGQTGEELREDFLAAVGSGATQVSTYPFIDFSYAHNRQKPLGRRDQRRMLDVLLATADEAGFVRTSVWTFGRKDAPRYSSVTRDCFLGFGPSATSLGLEAFKVNTFSVEAYAASVRDGIVPTALRMSFTPRTRRAYWLFWNCYNGFLSEEDYRGLFATELARDFPFWLNAGTRLGLLERVPLGGGWTLTKSGSYYFHLVEQAYTHQYIDKTWKLSMRTPWPERIKLY